MQGADALGVPDSVRPEEKGFAELALQSPSSAGYYYEEDGTLVLRVRDAADEPAAMRRAVSMRNADRIGDPASQANIRRRAPLMRIERATFTFKQLATWRDLAFDRAFGIDGVESLDLDERANRVTIGVAAARARDVEAAVTKTLREAGVDPAALRFVPAGPSKPMIAKLPLPLLTDERDSIVGGLSIHTVLGTCSVGFAAIRNGVAGMVTASHCTQEIFELDPAPSNARQGSRTIAYEQVDPHWYSCGVRFFGTYHCRGADAAFYAGYPGIAFGVGKIARPGQAGGFYIPGSIDITGNFEIVAVDNEGLTEGTRVDKVGQTTGWTTGYVTSTCIDIHMDRDDAIMRCGYMARLWADGGDSGGPLFSYPNISADNNRVKLEGTLYGGKYYGGELNVVFAKASRIRSDLGGTWQITYQGPVEPPTPYLYITGDQSLPAGEGGYWNANMSNYHTPTDCVWKIDGNAIDNGGDCSLGYNFNDSGPGYHILQVDGLDDGALKSSPEFMVQIYNGGCPTCNERKGKRPPGR